MENIDTLKIFLKDVLKQSGDIAKKYFNNGIEIELKPDESPVTIADKEIETYIRDRISEEYPEFGIIGEEFENVNEQANIKFVIDPIDGTKAFLKQIPTFGIMIGVIMDKKPILGAVYQPISDELWLGDNEKTQKNDVTIKANHIEEISNATIATTGYEYLNKIGIDFFEKLSQRVNKTILGGDCYNYCKLAEGEVNIVLEQGLKFHDYIPLIPILKGAGAFITDFNGNDITSPYKNVAESFLACSNDTLRNEVISILKKA